jgi:phage terminase small subunit
VTRLTKASAADKRELFARQYVIDRDGSRAAIAAGYAKGSAKQAAYKLLSEPGVEQRIKELTKAQLHTADITAERVFKELARLAFTDVRDLYDAEGNLHPIHKLSDDAAASIASIEVDVKAGVKGTLTHKVRRADKLGALNVLARHFKIIGAEPDETVSKVAAIAERMERATARLARLRKP